MQSPNFILGPYGPQFLFIPFGVLSNFLCYIWNQLDTSRSFRPYAYGILLDSGKEMKSIQGPKLYVFAMYHKRLCHQNDVDIDVVVDLGFTYINLTKIVWVLS